jgi:hypothetical protein
MMSSVAAKLGPADCVVKIINVQITLPINGIMNGPAGRARDLRAHRGGGQPGARRRAPARSPPAVARALAALEDRLGVRLVDRTTRRLAPTEAGPPSTTRRAASPPTTGGDGRARDAPVRGLLRITAPGSAADATSRRSSRSLDDRRRRGQLPLRPQHRSHRRGIDVALRIGPLPI